MIYESRTSQNANTIQITYNVYVCACALQETNGQSKSYMPQMVGVETQMAQVVCGKHASPLQR